MATPSIQMLENSEGARHTKVNSTNGVSGDRIQTHVDGVSATQAPDPHLGSHVHSLQGDHPQALPLQSHGFSVLGDPHPRPCTWGVMTLG